MAIPTLSDVQITTSTVKGLESVVGNTPLLPLRRITEDLSLGVQVFAKAEWFNPGGSVKDRPALNILRTAIDQGELNSGRHLLDSTSGNMGISYATFCASLGIPITITIPGNASPERITVLKALGAKLVLTDPFEGSDGAIRVARRMARDNPERYFYANQYNNPANWQAHFQTTGPEILQQVLIQTGTHVTHFTAGLGTTGTLMGTGRYLKEHDPEVEIVSFQPDSSFHGLEGLKHMESAIVPGIYDASLADRNLQIKTETAYKMTVKLAREEGLFVGISSGAAAVAALQIAERLDEGVVVTVFPDGGYKYLSDRFWEENV